MKFFDTRAALERIEKQGVPPAISAIPANSSDLEPVSKSRIAEIAGIAAPQPKILKFEPSQLPSEVEDMRHGTALSGNPKTWTGRIVSLDDWRRMSEWEKHGQNGRHWSGITKQWEVPE